MLLGLLLASVCSPACARVAADSLVMDRLFSYKRNLAPDIDGVEKDFYLKYTLNTVRRNPTLWLVPTMHSVSRGRRRYIGENVGKVSLRSITDYDISQQTFRSTIPHNRRAMDVMMRFIIPDLYGEALFGGYMLSPFCRANRRFYRYRIVDVRKGRTRIVFEPRVNNTQLVSGHAIVETLTGRIMRVCIRGEYDMVEFEVQAQMGDGDTPYALLPRTCDSRATFKFVGNEMQARFHANFDCDVAVPDSLADMPKSELIDIVRPDSLDAFEKAILAEYYAPAAPQDSVRKKKRENRRRKMADKAWDIIGDRLLSSQSKETGNASFRLSPLFNPLYLSYSGSRGLSYVLDVGLRYDFSPDRKITLTPRFGYNFKISQFYFNAPLRYTFSEKRAGWVELLWANGNRITNSDVLDVLREESRDTVDFSALNLDYFYDEQVALRANMRIAGNSELTVGCVYHERTAVNQAEMERVGKPSVYRSFAPMFKLTLQPTPLWPALTVNYERSFKGVLRSNIEYERWELDASYKRELDRLRHFNLRVGGGVYTNKSTSYFVDFANFHENYIPGGWGDDWTGDFQLLNSEWYNASRYYVRTNASYESPLLLLTCIPIVGRYIEKERIYVSLLQIQHTRTYSEYGYSLTNRYFSIGVFASFLNFSFNEFGSRFTFELFRNW